MKRLDFPTKNTHPRSLFQVFCLLLGLLFYTWPTGLLAVEVPGLYQGEVDVTSRNDERERQRAFSEAFRQVLIKVTGDTQVVNQPLIRRALANADDYVDSLSYQAKTDAEGNPAGIAMNVSFFEPQVRTLLDSAGIPLWPGNRPYTLVWMAVQEELGNRLLVGASTADYRNALARVSEEARNRGLPLLPPILDLEDRRAITVEDVWDMNAEKLLQASARYESESVLAIRLFRTVTGEVIGKSSYFLRDQVLELDSFESDEATFIRDSIELAAHELSAYYAVLLSGTDSTIEVNLTVGGVASAEDYAGLLAYVSGLTDVNGFQITSVNRETIGLRLATGGQLRQLVETIALNRNLQPVGDLIRNDNQVYLSYQWRGGNTAP